MDVFGDKDCTNAAAVWRNIGTCFPDQIGVDGKKFLNSLSSLKINGFRGLIIGSGFEGKYDVLRKANEIMPLYFNGRKFVYRKYKHSPLNEGGKDACPSFLRPRQ